MDALYAANWGMYTVEQRIKRNQELSGATGVGREGEPFAAMWSKRWSPVSWRNYLASSENLADLRALRQSTHTGRPLGSAEFVRDLEERTQRRLAPRRGGRPSSKSSDQASLHFCDGR